jgi:tight adherence protein B
MQPLLILIGLLFGASVLTIVSAWSTQPRTSDGWRPPADLRARVAVGVVAGLVVFAFTGWIAAGLAAIAGGWALAGRVVRRGIPVPIERSNALAGWCEQLRDLLDADMGLLGTINATLPTCPEPIRPQVTRLVANLRRSDPVWALRLFADQLDDADGDLVTSVLILATTRTGRTAELLSELATMARDRANMRTRILTAQSGDRTEANVVLTVSVIAVVGLVVFARGSRFLAVYNTTQGQAVLAVVFGLFAVGIGWLARLSRTEHPTRFLAPSTPVENPQ